MTDHGDFRRRPPRHVADARERTLGLVADLTDQQLLGPRLAIVNPLLWGIGHVAWFQESWVLRHGLGERPLLPRGDTLYDSSAIPHDTRWDLPLPSRADILEYLRRVRDEVVDRLSRREPTPELTYLALYAVFHEDMHDEAFLYTRQTLGYPAPAFPPATADERGGPLGGNARIPGGRFLPGSEEHEGFVFDNEKWAHEGELAAFRLAKAPVTQSEFASFVDDGGYRRPSLWSEAGEGWRASVAAEHPFHWRQANGGWERRDFDRWTAGGSSTLVTTCRRPARASATPRIARLFDSVPPDVKTISSGSQPSRPATRLRAPSTASRAARPRG